MAIISIRTKRILDVNEIFIKYTEYSLEELLGATVEELIIMLSLEEKIVSSIREAVVHKNTLNNIEVRICSKNGGIRYGLLSTEFISLDNDICMLIVINDYTDRKRFECEITRLDRLSLIGQMASGIGHEIRNPMTSVRGLLQLLKAKNDFANYINYFDVMIGELDRANTIIQEYLSLAKKDVEDLKPHNLNHILEAIYPLIYADAINSNVDLIIEKEELPLISLNEKEIRQLILNLVRNGLEAMTSGKKLFLSTYREGEQIILAVRDQGEGINPSLIDKLGTPFITTKDSGVGLGLATCYSIASRHNAAITCETSSSGTTFYVHFKIS
nr:ATP-binding protein [Desulforamulus aquiferis]